MEGNIFLGNSNLPGVCKTGFMIDMCCGCGNPNPRRKAFIPLAGLDGQVDVAERDGKQISNMKRFW